MSDSRQKARELLKEFKGDRYAFGLGCIDELGALARQLGGRAVVVASGVKSGWTRAILTDARASLDAAGVEVLGDYVPGAAPNSPQEDVRRVAEVMRERGGDVLIAIGGGSVIDAAKGSAVLAALGGEAMDIEPFFGVGKVSEALAGTDKKLTPMVAVELASGSGAHLTKYSNITDLATSQKKLIIDEAVVPPRAVFDYSHTASMSKDFTSDGALDGMSHCLEVLYGSKGDVGAKAAPICTLGIELIVRNLPAACRDGANLDAREALGLGTDLGGYAIMVGGTNGAHLNSFSMVDLLPHGRACALMNPYYTVFFAPAIEPQLRQVAAIFAKAGYLKDDTSRLGGRDLGVAVAEAMTELCRQIGFPTTLGEVPGFGDEHIARVLTAAKNPQLASKLQNMPVTLTAETVDEYMGSVLEAAKTGDFARVKNMAS